MNYENELKMLNKILLQAENDLDNGITIDWQHNTPMRADIGVNV